MEKITIQLEIPAEIVMLADIFDVTPEQILECFMNDLVSKPGNQGSDERRMAKEYFLRGGISRREMWLFDTADDLIELFADMYKENYPASANTEYAEKRKVQLDNWYARAKKLKANLIKKPS